MSWHDNDEGDEEGDPNRRHLCSYKNKLIDQAKTNGHQIVTTTGNQDQIEDSLLSSHMKEEEEEHAPSLKKIQR